LKNIARSRDSVLVISAPLAVYPEQAAVEEMSCKALSSATETISPNVA